MIDYISVNKVIELDEWAFAEGRWAKGTLDTGEVYLWAKIAGVIVRYYWDSQRLMVLGKLITLLYNSQVQNFDDIYGGMRDEFLDAVNDRLNGLFMEPVIDLREFVVTRIDYCFNIETPYVQEYLAFLSRAFQKTDTGARVDHTAKYGLHGSVYIKNASEYNKNVRYNYTLNIYDKLDRLRYQKSRGMPIRQSDLALAENVLRIEVQASHVFVKYLCQKLGIERIFDALFDYNVALYAIQTAYRRAFRAEETWDFFTYSEAKKRVGRDSAAGQLLYSAATNHNVSGSKYAYKRKKVAGYGIYPFCVLPKDSPVPVLENPVKLVRKKIRPFL